MSNESPDQGKCYDLKRRGRYFIGHWGSDAFGYRCLSFVFVSELLDSSSAIDAQCAQMSSLFGLPSFLKTHPWAIPGTKVDCAIDEPVRGASDTSLSFHLFPKQIFPLPLS